MNAFGQRSPSSPWMMPLGFYVVDYDIIERHGIDCDDRERSRVANGEG